MKKNKGVECKEEDLLNKLEEKKKEVVSGWRGKGKNKFFVKWQIIIILAGSVLIALLTTIYFWNTYTPSISLTMKIAGGPVFIGIVVDFLLRIIQPLIYLTVGMSIFSVIRIIVKRKM